MTDSPSPAPASDVSREAVLAALATVNDPDIRRPLTELGMIDNLTVCGGNVRFEIKLTTTACPLKQKIREDAEAAVRVVPGVSAVHAEFSSKTVTLGAKPPAQAPIEGIRNIIAVSSGKGGVGKTTVAVNLACAMAAEGARVGILDADIYGPNVPLMMGLGGAKLAQDLPTGKLLPPESHGVKVISMAFLVKDNQPVVWRGPMLDKVIRQFLTDVAWGELDYLIIDLPPGTGDAQLTIIQATPVVGAVIVTTPQPVAILDSRKGLAMFANANVPIFGIVENMSYYPLPDGSRDYLFGSGGGEAAARELDVPFLGALPLHSRLRSEADEGRPIVVSDPESDSASILRGVAHQVVAQICARGLSDASAPAALQPCAEPSTCGVTH
ncbi:MAG: Mrp/NBP35 family ATP-binding protein [Vampirovibrionales bacterium]|nr:Mrp/NBP35 family ATP-binding protein [Vampirovibrionales bacterium]